MTRRLAFLLAFAVLTLPAAAQVTTDPAAPTAGGGVTVFFDASQGTGGLAGYTGDVYAHTGVITNLSAVKDGCGGVDWRYVKTGWGENTAATRLERVEGDRYRLDIPDIRDYYGVPANEEILRLAFVFRSADASREGKGTGGCDLFVDLARGPVEVRLLEPTLDPLTPLIAARDTTVRVVAVAVGEGALGLRALVGGTDEVGPVANDTLAFDLTLDAPGRYDVTVVASNDAGESDSLSFTAVRNPPVVEAARPDVEDGVTFSSDGTSATFVLFAPYHDNVYLLGDFNDWTVDTDFFMRRETAGADSAWYWLTVDGLTPGEPYGFQYLVDGAIRVADPYSHLVLQPGDDAEIAAEGRFPNLPDYPDGRTQYAVGVADSDLGAYAWQHDDVERPPSNELVIYELLLRDFLEESTFDVLTDTLDYLDRLGVNAIELMPVSEFDGNRSWGYNPAFHLALDKYYGPPESLKRFVDAAHARGMAVILDVVYNHATGASPLIRLWNEGVYGDPTPENPYANVEARHPFNVFNDLDHESAATQYWLDRANRYWLEEFHVDGFRFDLSKGFTQKNTGSDVGAWGAYDASRVALLTRMADAIWAVDEDAIVILEHFGGQREENELTGYRRGEGVRPMLVWNNLNRSYNQLTMGYPTSDDFANAITCTYGPACGYTLDARVSYMESHDEQWLMYRNRAYGASAGGYDVRSLETALDRQKLAGAFFLLVPGPRMIWQFGELGYGYGTAGEECLRNEGNDECPAVAPGRVGDKPIRWDYLDDTHRRSLYDVWSALLALRQEHDVFTSPETDVTLDVGEDRRVRSFRLDGADLDVTVVGNFDVVEREAVVSFPAAGTYYDVFSDRSVTVGAGETAAEALAPGAFRVYASERLARPVITDRDEEVPAAALALSAAYPNPFNPQATIPYTLDRAGDARLAVYDVLGRRVAVLADGPHAPGAHTAVFDAEGLASGTYLVRLDADGRTRTRTVVLVK